MSSVRNKERETKPEVHMSEVHHNGSKQEYQILMVYHLKWATEAWLLLNYSTCLLEQK